MELLHISPKVSSMEPSKWLDHSFYDRLKAINFNHPRNVFSVRPDAKVGISYPTLFYLLRFVC